MQDKTDIVITTWNCKNYLELCIKSIQKYTHPDTYNIIVVNNGSTDNTKHYLKNLKKIFVVENKINLGYPKALRQGYLKTTSPIVCLMNDDIIVSKKWMSNALDIMKQNNNIGILGPTRPGAHFIHPYTKKLSKSKLEDAKIKITNPLERLNYFCNGKKYDEFVEDYKKANPPNLTVYNTLPNIVSTCCAFVNRKAIEKSGGIVDTRFVKYGGDDVDLSWRLMKNGYDIAITAAVYVHHFEHVSMDNGEVDRKAYLNKNANILFQKWKPEINKLLKAKLKNGETKENILSDSWLLERLSQSVGPEFWELDSQI